VNNLVFGLVSGKGALFGLRGVTKYSCLLHFRTFSEVFVMVRPKKYMKSEKQRMKEETRRERLLELLTRDLWTPLELLVHELGVSVSTVTRDKRKFGVKLRDLRRVEAEKLIEALEG